MAEEVRVRRAQRGPFGETYNGLIRVGGEFTCSAAEWKALQRDFPDVFELAVPIPPPEPSKPPRERTDEEYVAELAAAVKGVGPAIARRLVAAGLRDVAALRDGRNRETLEAIVPRHFLATVYESLGQA